MTATKVFIGKRLFGVRDGTAWEILRGGPHQPNVAGSMITSKTLLKKILRKAGGIQTPTLGPWTMVSGDLAAGVKCVVVSESENTDVAYVGCNGQKQEVAEADARLIASAPDLLTERQQISTELAWMGWKTPQEAEQLLRDFIEKFHYSEAVAKATGVARLDKAVEAMMEEGVTT